MEVYSIHKSMDVATPVSSRQSYIQNEESVESYFIKKSSSLNKGLLLRKRKKI